MASRRLVLRGLSNGLLNGEKCFCGRRAGGVEGVAGGCALVPPSLEG